MAFRCGDGVGVFLGLTECNLLACSAERSRVPQRLLLLSADG